MFSILTLIFGLITMFFVSVLKRRFLEPLMIPVVAIAQFIFVMFVLTSFVGLGFATASFWTFISIWWLYGAWSLSAVQHVRRK